MRAQIEQMQGAMMGMKAQIAEMKKQMEPMIAQRDEMTKKIDNLQATIDKMTRQRKKMIAQRAEMDKAIREMKSAIADIKDAQWKMGELKKGIPAAFEGAKANYMKALDDKEGEIKQCYQDTLNVGFRQMFELTACASVVGILLLLMYRKKKEV